MSYCGFEDNCWSIDYIWCEGCKFYNECYCKHKLINNANDLILKTKR